MSESKQAKEAKEKIPEEFERVIHDFVHDVKTTFPEYTVFIHKWWKEEAHFKSIEDDAERKQAFEKAQKNSVQFLFRFCLKKFPPRFFDILYQNNDIFADGSDVDTEFLPQIHFKNLWECEISAKTRETIWKYLQLIMFSIVGSVENREAFGDSTAEMFESMDSDAFRSKLEETMNDIQTIFETNGSADAGANANANSDSERQMPNAENIYSHVSGMLGGKLGKLAKEIAEETAEMLNIDMENTTDPNDVMKNLMKNPTKMMGLVKNIGSKLDSKIKSGEIKESELMSEASEMIQKMKDIPGMGNIQEILSKMGIGGKHSKVNLNAMQEQLDRNMKAAQTRERMRNNVQNKQRSAPAPAPAPPTKPLSDAELIQLLGKDVGQENKPKKDKKDKKDKKAKKAK